jgi:hypothetical protein
MRAVDWTKVSTDTYVNALNGVESRHSFRGVTAYST